MKNVNVSPRNGLRIVVYTLFAYWLFTYYERISVMHKHSLPIEANAKTIKYLLGLSHSAAEVEVLLDSVKELEALGESLQALRNR